MTEPIAYPETARCEKHGVTYRVQDGCVVCCMEWEESRNRSLQRLKREVETDRREVNAVAICFAVGLCAVFTLAGVGAACVARWLWMLMGGGR